MPYVLISGRAGFIGSHTGPLLARGDQVRVRDSLDPQVHGPEGTRPEYLHPDVELIRGDVRDAGAVRRALRGIAKRPRISRRAG
jgi:dTDP-L-rhamnose 4-epimerase